MGESVADLVARHTAEMWDCYSRGQPALAQLHAEIARDLEALPHVRTWSNGRPIVRVWARPTP